MKQLLGFLWGLLVCALISMFTGCTTTKYVPVPEYHYKDSVRVVNHRDSIYSRDSIFVYSKGDTIYHEHFNMKYKEFLHNDTIVANRVDSVRVPYPVEKTVVKHALFAYQRFFMWIGIISLVGIIALVIWRIKRRI